jgi:hypothetical protein
VYKRQIIAGDAQDITTGDFAIHVKFAKENITDANAFIVNKEASGVGYGLEVRTNDLWIRLDDGTVDVSAIIGTNVFSAGVEYDVFVTFDRSGNATAYVNGVSVGTVAISTAGLTLTSAGVFTIGSETGATTKAFGGEIGLVELFNFLPTDSEVKALISGNIPAKWAGGAQPYISDFSAGTDGWEVNAGCTIDGNIDSIGGQDNNLRLTVSGGAATHSMKRTTPSTSLGQTIELSFDYYIPSTNTLLDSLRVFDSKGAAYSAIFAVVDAWTSVSLSLISSDVDNIRIYPYGPGISFDSDGDVLYIRNVNESLPGVLSLYDQSSISETYWYDKTSGNNGAVTGAEVLNAQPVAVNQYAQPVFSVTSGITANVGSVQGNTPLVSYINQIATCANAGDAVTLQAATPGLEIKVYNDGANAADVFPASGDNIDEAGANTAHAVAADAEVIFTCTSAGHWSTITSA